MRPVAFTAASACSLVQRPNLLWPTCRPSTDPRRVQARSTTAGPSAGGGGGEADADVVEELAEAFHVRELVVKRSRFVACAGRATSDAEARAFLDAARDAAASHNCWAFALGDGRVRRSDDGEPSGTAGAPILRAIQNARLVDVAVCVVRYFGGVKLGAGGLTRAYGEAAALCLAEAPRTRRLRSVDIVVDVAHAHIGAVLAVFSRTGTILDVDYTARGANVRARVPARDREAVRSAVQDATRGTGECREADPLRE